MNRNSGIVITAIAFIALSVLGAEKAPLCGFFVKPFVDEAVPSAIGKAPSMSTEYRSGVNPQERSALYSSR